MTIKAIETCYKGYRFRSRLEARWAVFMDAASIPWRYEEQGFDLGGGICYLPDFWLPMHDLFLEIKPRLEERSDRVMPGLELCSHLAEQSGKDVVMISGDCWPGEYRLLVLHGGDGDLSIWGDGPGSWPSSRLRKCRRCEGLCYVHLSNEEDWWAWGDVGKHTCGDHGRAPLEFDNQHYERARSARFEHGECP